MSALVGIAYLDKRPSRVSGLTRPMGWLAFYGPDGSDVQVLGSAVFGHQMLFTTPESERENLPLVVDDRWLITADSRLDNRQDLFAQLEISDRESPDSLLLLRAYQKWGRDCPAHLLGDYAFAIWDEQEQTLFCGRDHIGAKPFYYYQGQTVIAFASEIEPLLLLDDVPDQIDEQEIARFLLMDTSAYHSNHHTFYKDVFRLPFGTTLSASPEGHSIKRYWFPEEIPPLPAASEKAYAEQLIDLLYESISCRLRTGHPIGAHISGGLDSSAVCIIANRMLKENGRSLTGYSWSAPPDAVDAVVETELRRIQMIAEQEGIPVHYVDRVELLRKGQLDTDQSLRPIHTLAFERIVEDMAQQHAVRVMLSGWGGDEFITFNGRGHRIQQFRKGQWWGLIKNLKGPEASFLSFAGVKNITANFYNDVLKTNSKNTSSLVFIEPPAYLRLTDSGETLSRPYDRIPETGNSARETQINLYYSGHVGYRMESWAWSGAEHRIVYTYPLTDRRLLEFAFGLPGDMYAKNGWNRYLFRLVAEDIFPEGMTWNRYGSIKVDTTLRGSLRREIAQHAAEKIKLDDNADEKDLVPVENSREKREEFLEAVRDNPWIDIQALREYTPAKRRQNPHHDPKAISRTRKVLPIYKAWKDRQIKHDE